MSLQDYSDQIYKCIRCGACRAVCPTFGEELNETCVARGRVALAEAVLSGDLELTAAFEKTIFDCAMCGACKAGCPAGVDVPGIIEAARAELVDKKKSEPLIRFLAKKSLKNKHAMDRAFMLMSLGNKAYGPLAATPFAKLLPYQSKDVKRSFPDIPRKPLAARLPALSRAENSRGTVALFAGCVINYVYPEIGEASVKALNAAGYDVMIIKDEVCCGKPLKSLGEMDEFKRLAEQNIKLFGGLDVEAIITACPTCALTLRDDFPKILDGEDHDVAVEIASKIQDITKFLITRSELISQITPEATLATYHDPCHLNFGMGIKSEPRQLIRASATLVEMPDSERCCGFGGSFSFLNYSLSSRISSRKATGVLASGANLVVTSCPGCMMHLRDAMKQAGVDAQVIHTIELVARNLK